MTVSRISNILYEKEDSVFESGETMESGKLKNSIAEAAIECFREKGYEDTSVTDICQQAGIVRSTFYRMFSNKKEIVHYLMHNSGDYQVVGIEELLSADNDFERMWVIGERYMSLSEKTGPDVMGAVFGMELQGQFDLTEMIASINDWFVRLTRNCQRAGIIRSTEAAEDLGPALVDQVRFCMYMWSAYAGKYPMRSHARRLCEMMADLAPEYRWPEEKMKKADRRDREG